MAKIGPMKVWKYCFSPLRWIKDDAFKHWEWHHYQRIYILKLLTVFGEFWHWQRDLFPFLKPKSSLSRMEAENHQHLFVFVLQFIPLGKYIFIIYICYQRWSLGPSSEMQGHCLCGFHDWCKKKGRISTSCKPNLFPFVSLLDVKLLLKKKWDRLKSSALWCKQETPPTRSKHTWVCGGHVVLCVCVCLFESLLTVSFQFHSATNRTDWDYSLQDFTKLKTFDTNS